MRDFLHSKMTSFSGLGIGLSTVFGFLLLAFAAELYYLLWWKRRFNNRVEAEDDVDYSTNYAKDLFHLICWKKPSSLQSDSNQESGREAEGNGEEAADLEMGKDLLIKAFGTEESVEAELMRLHNLAGPPRFLFTINEETREDLESEDGKSRTGRSRKGSRTRSLSDVMLTATSPPLASPRLKSPILNGMESYHHNYGFNPLFEEAELNKLKSSPPPKFKFLRDAEEKLLKRLMEEAEKKASSRTVVIQDSGLESDEKLEGSFLGFIVGGKNKEIETTSVHHHPPQQNSSSSAQVPPLISSPTTTATVLRLEMTDKNQQPIIH